MKGRHDFILRALTHKIKSTPFYRTICDQNKPYLGLWFYPLADHCEPIGVLVSFQNEDSLETPHVSNQ